MFSFPNTVYFLFLFLIFGWYSVLSYINFCLLLPFIYVLWPNSIGLLFITQIIFHDEWYSSCQYFQFPPSRLRRRLHLPVLLKLDKVNWLALANDLCHFWWKHLKTYECGKMVFSINKAGSIRYSYGKKQIVTLLIKMNSSWMADINLNNLGEIRFFIF